MRRIAACLLLALAWDAPLARADATKGEELYAQRCLGCHVPAAEGGGGAGPRLWKLIGRPTASAEDYVYSPALKAARIVWTRERLDAYVKDPRRVVDGTTMTFKVGNAAERRHILDYLETLR